jgi:hypothetical protein
MLTKGKLINIPLVGNHILEETNFPLDIGSTPYAERHCRGCDLGKVEDEEHLLLVCPSTQKVREHFCSTLPLTHTSTFAELMQITNTVALAKFVTCCLYQRIICPP